MCVCVTALTSEMVSMSRQLATQRTPPPTFSNSITISAVSLSGFGLMRQLHVYRAHCNTPV